MVRFKEKSPGLFLLRNYLGVGAAADYVCYFYFQVFVGFCVADKDWKAFNFSDTFPVWTHINYVYFEFVSNLKGVIYTFAAFVFCVSWSSFFWAKETSSSLSTLCVFSNTLHMNKRFVLTELKISIN
jgi:hypothetical protein